MVITFFLVRYLCKCIPESSNQNTAFLKLSFLIGHYSCTGTKIVLESFMTVRPCQQYNQQYQEECEDVKVIIRIRKSKKNRKRNGQKKKYKSTNNDIQNIHIKLKIE